MEEYKILVTVNTKEKKAIEDSCKEKTLQLKVTESDGSIDINWQEKCHALIIAAETIAKQNDGSVLDILPVVTEFLNKEREEK